MESNVIEQTVAIESIDVSGEVPVAGDAENHEVDLLGEREMFKGDRGFSAYEVAVENGFKGSEEEWLASLKGEEGPAPYVGENGNWFVGEEDTGVPAEGKKELDDETKGLIGCLTMETIGHVDSGTGDIINEDEVIVYQAQTSRKVRGYQDEVNVDRAIWFNDADADQTYQNEGTYLKIKHPVVYNDSVKSKMPTGKFFITAEATPGDWAWVGIFKGHYELEDLINGPQAEVYCYLDAWWGGQGSGGHGNLHGVEFDILEIYDAYAGHHNNYWFFPPCEYTVALYADDSYSNPIEVVRFKVLDAAWRCRGYDESFMYNPATKTLKVPNIESENLPAAPMEDGEYRLTVTTENGEKKYSWEVPGEGGGGVVEETDPTVPAWAKQEEKPSYTAEEVGALPASTKVALLDENNCIDPNNLPLAAANASGAMSSTDKTKLDRFEDASNYAKKSDLPTSLPASDVYDWAKKSSKPTYNASEVGADPSGTSVSVVGGHNVNNDAHNDIRLLIQGLTTRLNTIANSSDVDLDQLAEIVAYIKSNRTLIESVTTNKVNVSDIINNLTTNVATKPLAAAQGVVLKGMIDNLQTLINAIKVPTKLSELSGDSSHRTVTDAEKQAWNNKQPAGNYALKSEIPTNYAKSDHTHDEFARLSEEIADLLEQTALSQYFVDSVEEMTDTTKKYVLKSTGTVWEYTESTVEQEVTVTDQIVGTTDNPYLVGRIPSSGTTPGSASEYVLTPWIDFTKEEYQGKTIELHLEGLSYITETNQIYVQNQILGTDKTTMVKQRGYSCLDTTYGNLHLMADDYKIIGTNSAVLTFNLPRTYDENSMEIGYIRFCAKGIEADSNVYITYQDTQTVEGGQWVDTEKEFGYIVGGSVDAETLAKIAELNNEGSDPTTIKLLAKPVLDFYNASAYSDSDYTTSHLEKVTYPCRADIPVPFNVKWNHNEEAMRTTLVVDTKAIGTLNAYRMRIYDVTGLDNYPIYNLLPNTRYYYKVTHVLADGNLVEAKSGSFITSDESIRLIHIDGTQNVRDLGGWTGLNGKKVKYGNLFRGATFGDSTFNNLMLTGKGKLALGELKVQAELNLGASDVETSIAPNCLYKKIGYNNYAGAITDATSRGYFKEALEWIVSCLNSSKPVYFHCQGGCDRTGTLSFQLLGLLGVSESDIAKEYELSSFSDIGLGRLRTTTKAVNTYDYVGMVEAIKTYSGSTITDKFYNFAIACGVSADTITAFRNLMLE